jgi:hypothetical protein
MEKIGKRILWFPAAALSTLTLTAVCSPPATAQQAAAQPQVLRNAVVNEAILSDVSRPLAELVATASAQQQPQTHVMHGPMKPKLQQLTSAALGAGTAAAVQPLTSSPLANTPLVNARTGLSFEGVGQVGSDYSAPEGNFCPSASGLLVVPPDTNAAVGDTQVVQWVNLCYAVFDKASGALIGGPFAGTNFWKGFGGGCEADNDGDIIIQWDKANHRWLASQNDFGPAFAGPYQTCIAVSQTADATGSYNRYAFPQPGFPDYPKWGLNRSVYYQTQNNFGPAGNGFVGVTVCAYQAERMLRGSSRARQVCIVDDSNGTLFDDSMVPADDDTAGPTGPEVLLGAIDNFLPGDTHVYEFVYSVDFEEPENSTLAGVNGTMPISVPAFDLALCVSGGFLTLACVPQPDSEASEVFFGRLFGIPPGGLVDTLDTLGDRLMYRLARSVDAGGTQHFLVAHSVNNTHAVATRWYEFRAPQGSTSLSLYQSGQTPDDQHYRWMGSIARDRQGDIALGYSRSSAERGDYPSIYLAGQTAGDPLGTTEREVRIKKGGGSQYVSFDRWGDYSSMALDGADSCTFWYTNEFYPVDGSLAWDTWVTELKFPNCH